MLTVAFYWLVTSFFRLCVLIWSRRQVLGLENVPRHGPAILASNHINLADPPLLATLVPRRLIFMAKLELFRHKIHDVVLRNMEPHGMEQP